jgi:hypothetical protein
MTAEEERIQLRQKNRVQEEQIPLLQEQVKQIPLLQALVSQLAHVHFWG